MRKFIIAVAALAALAATAAIAAPADASVRHFRNCTAMHTVYPHGIATSRAAAKAHGWQAKVSASLYKANKQMDRDRDGVACERASKWSNPAAGRCKDVTSYDWNWDNDMKCRRSDGSIFYTDYAGAERFERKRN
jgi:hypothetical protein